MTRRVGIGAAFLIWWATTGAAQTLSPASIRTSVERETRWLAAIDSWRDEQRARPLTRQARSFKELQALIKKGDTIYIVDTAGVETRGVVEALSDVSLTLSRSGARREFVESEVARIERGRRDSVRNGLLLGAATGAGIGFVAGRRADSPSCPRSGIECGQGAVIGTAGGAFWGGVGGWIADTLIQKREAVYLPDRQP
jgi:hypothetical protein